MGIIGLSQPEDTVSISLLSSTVALTDFLPPPHLLQHLLSLEGRDCALQLLCGEGHPLLSVR